MIRKAIQLLVLFTFLSNWSFAQYGTTCSNADIFCSGVTYNFPMPTDISAETGPDYGCLASQPNPSWFYLRVTHPGDLEISIATNPPRNINFAVWGPFTSPTAACDSMLTSNCSSCPSNTTDSLFYPSGNLFDCSYDTSSSKMLHINGVQMDQYYIFMISNESNLQGNLIIEQSNLWQNNSAYADCSSCTSCSFESVSSSVSNCNPYTNTFSISGGLFYPSLSLVLSDSIVVTDSISGKTDIFYQPFSSPIFYQIDSIPTDGLTHNISVWLSSCSEVGNRFSVLSPEPCNFCYGHAGQDSTICGNVFQLNALVTPDEVDNHWIPLPDVTFSNIESPISTVQVNTYDSYDFAWQTMNSNGSLCIDFVTIEFVEDFTPEISIANDTLFSSVSSGNQWYNQNGIIAGADTNFLVLQGNGEYFVIVENECVQDSSEIFVYSSVSQWSYSGTEPKFVLNGNMLSIESTTPLKEITVYTLLGQPVMRKENMGLNCTLNFESQHGGLYLIQFRTENGSFTKIFPVGR